MDRLNNDYPSHDFDIDYHLAKGLGLKVRYMDPVLFMLADSFINLCVLSKKEGEICGFIPRNKLEESSEDFRAPYFKVFNVKKEVVSNGSKNEGRQNGKK